MSLMGEFVVYRHQSTTVAKDSLCCTEESPNPLELELDENHRHNNAIDNVAHSPFDHQIILLYYTAIHHQLTEQLVVSVLQIRL